MTTHITDNSFTLYRKIKCLKIIVLCDFLLPATKNPFKALSLFPPSDTHTFVLCTDWYYPGYDWAGGWNTALTQCKLERDTCQRYGMDNLIMAGEVTRLLKHSLGVISPNQLAKVHANRNQKPRIWPDKKLHKAGNRTLRGFFCGGGGVYLELISGVSSGVFRPHLTCLWM